MRKVVVFLILACVFTMVHYGAEALSLYWYYWWFDNVMHFWGGVMIGFGMHALAALPHFHRLASLWWVLAALAVATLSWEVFEWSYGLYESATHGIDTIKDIAVAWCGGLLVHAIIQERNMKKII